MRNRLRYYSKHEGLLKGFLFYIILIGKLGLGIIKGFIILLIGRESLKMFLTRVKRWFDILLLQSSNRGAS
jgi:hypothetical protein